MNYDEIIPFLETNHRAVVTTFRRGGGAQNSIVTCGPYGGGVAFTTTASRAKLHNLLRDPRCTILVARDDWSAYVVVEGRADIRWRDRTSPDDLRITLRQVYQSASGREHPNWGEYDAAMVEQGRAAIIVMPDRIYGTGIV